MTIADSNDNVNTIFEKKAKFPYSKLPSVIQPTAKYNNRREFMFSKLNSMWQINSATRSDVGRSKTINFFHGSEAAFWKSISDMFAGMGEALTASSIQILETTGNGFNEYKDLWDFAGDDMPGDNTWERLFYYWFYTLEYRMDFDSEEKHNKFLEFIAYGNGTEGEKKNARKLKKLKEIHKIEGEQLYWYYNKWKSYFEKEILKQEYPCSPEEGFNSSGSYLFKTEKKKKKN